MILHIIKHTRARAHTHTRTRTRTHTHTAHPPVAFVFMAADRHRARAIKQQIAALRDVGVPASGWEVGASPVTPATFGQRGGGEVNEKGEKGASGGVVSLQPALAKRVTAALREATLLDAKGYLVEDPRRTPWRQVVGAVVPASVDTLVADESPISEAFAFHEFTDAHLASVLDWLDERTRDRRT